MIEIKTLKLQDSWLNRKQAPSINSSRSRCSICYKYNYFWKLTHLAACMKCSIANSFNLFIIAKILNLLWCFIPALPSLKIQFKTTMFLLLSGTITGHIARQNSCLSLSLNYDYIFKLCYTHIFQDVLWQVCLIMIDW